MESLALVATYNSVCHCVTNVKVGPTSLNVSSLNTIKSQYLVPFKMGKFYLDVAINAKIPILPVSF